MTKKTKVTRTISMDLDLHDALLAAAEEYKETISGWVQEAISEKLQRDNIKKQPAIDILKDLSK